MGRRARLQDLVPDDWEMELVEEEKPPENPLGHLFFAVWHRDAETVQRLLQEAPELASTWRKSSESSAGPGELALHYAARLGGGAQIVQLLLAAAPSTALLTNSRGETPLLLAVVWRNTEEARLLAAAAPAAALQPARLYEHLPLHVAAVEGRTSLVRVLLDAAPAAASVVGTEAHCTPLHMATCACRHSGEPVRLLLAASPESAMTPCRLGRLPLHWAVMQKNVRAVRLLLEAAPAAALVPDSFGCTPLALAASRGGYYEVGEVIRLLVLAAPATAAAASHRSSTPLHLVSEWGGREAAAALLAAAPAAATQLNEDLDSPLACAASLGDPHVVALLLTAARHMAGVRNRAGRLPLDIALDRLEQALEVGGCAAALCMALVCCSLSAVGGCFAGVLGAVRSRPPGPAACIARLATSCHNPWVCSLPACSVVGGIGDMLHPWTTSALFSCSPSPGAPRSPPRRPASRSACCASSKRRC